MDGRGRESGGCRPIVGPDSSAKHRQRTRDLSRTRSFAHRAHWRCPDRPSDLLGGWYRRDREEQLGSKSAKRETCERAWRRRGPLQRAVMPGAQPPWPGSGSGVPDGEVPEDAPQSAGERGGGVWEGRGGTGAGPPLVLPPAGRRWQQSRPVPRPAQPLALLQPSEPLQQQLHNPEAALGGATDWARAGSPRPSTCTLPHGRRRSNPSWCCGTGTGGRA